MFTFHGFRIQIFPRSKTFYVKTVLRQNMMCCVISKVFSDLGYFSKLRNSSKATFYTLEILYLAVFRDLEPKKNSEHFQITRFSHLSSTSTVCQSEQELRQPTSKRKTKIISCYQKFLLIVSKLSDMAQVDQILNSIHTVKVNL